MIKVFIGYDSNETVAYHVLAHSIMENATYPVSITPIMRTQLRHVFGRLRNQIQSTEFSFSRFLVPYLCDYEGWAIFMDCDFLCFRDIYDLWKLRDYKYDLMVCQHDYTPKETTKFLGAVQTKYEKKNWSSLMLFNNKRCKELSPLYVNTASGLELHQFKWCQGEIGEIDKKWNHLVGCYEYIPNPYMVHWTLGGPWFHDYRDTEYSGEWFSAREKMLHAAKTNITSQQYTGG